MEKQRYEAIDSLRGIAALGVVVYHLALGYEELYGFQTLNIPGWIEAFRYGPHFFYMISGFVIFLTLDRHTGFVPFMRARLIRLLPAFWVCLPVAALVGTWLGPDDAARTVLDVFINGLFLQGVLDTPHVDLAYWSLLIEMSFYLLAGVLIAHFNLRHRLTLLLSVWLVISFLGMLYWDSMNRFGEIVFKELLIVRYSIYFIPGIIFYRAIQDGWLRHSHKFLLVGCGMLMVGSLPLAYGLQMVVLMVVFWASVQGKLNWLLCYRPLLWLGAISYPLYVSHQVIGTALIHNLQASGVNELFSLVFAIVFSIVLAWIVHQFVEKAAWKRLKRPH